MLLLSRKVVGSCLLGICGVSLGLGVCMYSGSSILLPQADTPTTDNTVTTSVISTSETASSTSLNVPVPTNAPKVETAGENAALNRAMPFSSSINGFSLHKMGTGHSPTLLVVGGIQGDEPGGFSAASLLATHYTITGGSVWVVPDLNYASILERNRGLFGDMNRKFAALAEADPEYATVNRIKSVLLDDAVDLVLNLHDGSGFYRPTRENAMRNPSRWGQSVIIDQEEMPGTRFNRLATMATQAGKDANAALIHPEHRYHTRNTNTRLGDREMEKTLSYFAVCNGKPAFGIEASKEFTTEFRSYYHVLMVESFMRQMGITFTRDFPLTPAGVLAALNSNLALAAYDGKLVLPLEDIRPTLTMVPFKKGVAPASRATKPLLALVPDKGDWRVAYGNRTLTRLRPVHMDFDDSLSRVELIVDGKLVVVRPGETVTAAKSVMVADTPGYRVNAIGAQKEKNGTEAGVELFRKDFAPRFSVDKSATTYRLEIYKEKAFAGMVLVRFGDSDAVAKEPLTAVKGPESRFGF